MNKQLTTAILLISGLVLSSCHYTKNKNNMNVTAKNKVEQMPPNTLETFETCDGKVFLTYIQPLFENSHIWQSELKPMGKPTGNGDYFLMYDIISGDYPKVYSDSRSYLHIIPDSGRFKMEDMLVSQSMYALLDNGEMATGHADLIMGWSFVGYSTDKNNVYAQILDYYTKIASIFKNHK